jgi:ATP-dependent Clp protease ATP-binding subunit ClpA
MFERFTHDARQVVVQAQQEALELGAARIGAEHLLLGVAAASEGAAGSALRGLGLDHATLRAELAASAGGLDAAALASIGIDLDEVRRRVEASFGPGALHGRGRGRVPFTPGAKKALELALREALALGDRDIRAEHLVLGVVRGADKPLTVALGRCGHTPATIRAAMLRARRPAA